MSFTLPAQARALAPQPGEADRARFFVATASVFGAVPDPLDPTLPAAAPESVHNEVSCHTSPYTSTHSLTPHGNNPNAQLLLLDYDEDLNEISTQAFPHARPVSRIAPAPDKADLVFTVHDRGASLWLLGAPDEQVPSSNPAQAEKLANSNGTLSELLNIPNPYDPQKPRQRQQRLQFLAWDPVAGARSSAAARVILATQKSAYLHTLDRFLSTTTPTQSLDIKPSDDYADIQCVDWNPHNSDVVCLAVGADVLLYDLRASPNESVRIPFAHDQCVRDLDHNPNKPYHIATGGNDGRVRIWDTRNCKMPLKDITHHTHWVWSVDYNRFHDQLILSSGSDCLVNLHNVVSVSSTPWGLIRSLDDGFEDRIDGVTDEIKQTDELIATYREFEDSVYAVAWSSADPWIFASVSFDGHVNINVVPRDVKYSIIL
ncbi:Protein tssc1 [Entophlyctis luteolus]|nr:Protein tssc1 [Entophlyctis luteolus]